MWEGSELTHQVNTDITQTLITWTTSSALFGGMFDRLACSQLANHLGIELGHVEVAQMLCRDMLQYHFHSRTRESAQTSTWEAQSGASITRST